MQFGVATETRRRNNDGRSDLGPLFKHLVDVSEASGSTELSEDLPEEFLRVNISLTSPVVLLLALPSLVLAKACSPVRVILLPLHLITEHLDTKTRAGKVNLETSG